VVNYKTIEPQLKFTAFVTFTDAAGMLNHELPQSIWEVTFADKDQNTLVEIQIAYEDLAHLETIINMGFKEGLAMGMEGLDELLLYQNSRTPQQ
jgi:hypothetical protein